MVCPLCGERRARRGCPALDRQICAVCCGTKRLTEIRCPSDCPYLATAREHPPAAIVRQQQRDVGLLVHSLRDLSQRQSELFLAIATFLVRCQPTDLHPIIDDDVAEMAETLAATYETASRGVIYEHTPASLPAHRLATALRHDVLEAAAAHGGRSAFERDAAVVLRRVHGAVQTARAREPKDRRAFLDLLARVLRTAPGDAEGAPAGQPAPRLIVP